MPWREYTCHDLEKLMPGISIPGKPLNKKNWIQIGTVFLLLAIVGYFSYLLLMKFLPPGIEGPLNANRETNSPGTSANDGNSRNQALIKSDLAAATPPKKSAIRGLNTSTADANNHYLFLSFLEGRPDDYDVLVDDKKIDRVKSVESERRYFHPNFFTSLTEAQRDSLIWAVYKLNRPVRNAVEKIKIELRDRTSGEMMEPISLEVRKGDAAPVMPKPKPTPPRTRKKIFRPNPVRMPTPR